VLAALGICPKRDWDITRSIPECWIKNREAFEKYRRLAFLQEFVNGFVGTHFSKVYCQHLLDHYLIGFQMGYFSWITQGYGMFGGKDYYVLLAEMNRVYDENVTENQKRVDGINIEFYDNHDEILFPNLTESSIWTWTNKQPRRHDNQGQYCSEDDWNYCNHFK